MTTTSSNILPFTSPFPSSRPSPSAAPIELVRRLDREDRLSKLDSLDPDERAAYVASIIRPAILIAKRKRGGPSCLPPQLREWLHDLCDAGDPTCRMIRDWLAGNLRFSADHADHSRHNGEDA